MTERTTSMPAALRRRREYAGPTLFSYGFRPFFLGGALWAALGVLLWLPQYFGELSLPTAFAPLDWHIHEMLYGYVAAVVAGFLLTAIPNWTGRLPVNGYPLAGLGVLWLAGRVAVAGSAIWGAGLAAVIDVAFLATLAAVALREIVAGKNWRNLRVLIVLGVLIAGNIVFHLEVIKHGSADYGIRLGIAAAIGLIMLVGGRIVPSFTHNWLVRNTPGRLPRQVRAIRCTRARRQRAGARNVDRVATTYRVRRGADDCWRAAGCAARALGRRPHLRRSSRSCAPRRLCFRSDRLPPAWRGDPVAVRVASERRLACLDGRSNRSDDPCGDDARKPRPYRARACGVGAHTGDLFVRAGRRARPHRRGVRTVERAALRRNIRLGAGIRRLCRDFRPIIAGSPAHAGGADVIGDIKSALPLIPAELVHRSEP